MATGRARTSPATSGWRPIPPRPRPTVTCSTHTAGSIRSGARARQRLQRSVSMVTGRAGTSPAGCFSYLAPPPAPRPAIRSTASAASTRSRSVGSRCRPRSTSTATGRAGMSRSASGAPETSSLGLFRELCATVPDRVTLSRWCHVSVAVLAVGIVQVVPLSHPALAAPGHSAHVPQMGPPVMEQAAMQAEMPASSVSVTTTKPAVRALATRASGPQREVFGFVNASNLGDPNVGYVQWNFNLLTTVAFFSLQVNSGDGHLVTTTTGWGIYHSTTMTNFVNTAHASGVRVIVSLNVHDFSTSPTNQVCQALIPANARTTITEAIAQMNWAGIDGININYEGTDSICANTFSSRDQLTDMVKWMRQAMPAGSYLAID